jgi:DedD protein
VDSPLKERLTGALIVVAVLVIVVPEMLSGPDKPATAAGSAGNAGPPVRTYSLELGSNATPRSEDQSALTPQSAQAPPAAALSQASPAPAVSEPPAAPQAAPQEREPAAMPEQAALPDVKPAAPQATGNKGQWWTQLGSFSARENADRLARDLRGKGYSITVAKLRVGSKDLYRVRAGPVASREAAVGLQSRLAAAGRKSSLVPP